MSKALILTVGTSVDPEVYAILQLKPNFVAFLCTKSSVEKTKEIVLRTGLKPGQIKDYEVKDDPSQIGKLVAQAHEAYKWALDRVGESGEVKVNPTAGRKWMSTGLTLYASQISAELFYVDVKQVNGKPDPSTMKLVNMGNPDDATGMLRAPKAAALFNRHDFDGASQAFGSLKPALSAPSRLYRELARVSKCLAKWDRFEHYNDEKVGKDLKESLAEVRQAADELSMAAVFDWTDEMQKLAEQIAEVNRSPKPSFLAVADLVANAERKLRAGRFEDAAARTYRALEAVAQWMLQQKGVNASQVDWDGIAEEAKNAFQSSPVRKKPETLPDKIGLTDAAVLARALGCEHADLLFDENGAFRFANHLEIRNKSILAHGWCPATQNGVQNFLNSLKQLLNGIEPGILKPFEVPSLPDMWS